MSNMSYCRHENTVRDLEDVWEQWEDYSPGSDRREDEARQRLVKLVREMHAQFEFDGTYDELASA